MATPIDTVCRACHENIPAKHRRVIFGETFGVFQQLCEVIGYVPRQNDSISRYVCGYCFTKLNKLFKIDFELQNRLDNLKAEKTSIITTMRSKFLAGNIQPLSPKMPHSSGKSPMQTTSVTVKHRIQHSPTPRKVKKSMHITSPRIPLPAQEEKTKVKRKRVSIQLFSPDKVKVFLFPMIYNYIHLAFKCNIH